MADINIAIAPERRDLTGECRLNRTRQTNSDGRAKLRRKLKSE
jgi:hypothetical protein